MLALLAGFASVTADVLLSGPLTRLDWAVHVFVERQMHRPWWWWLARILKLAGHQVVLTAPLGALCLFAAIRYRTWRPVLVVFLVAGALAVIVPGLKILTGRTPPNEEVDLVFTGETEYPSGHAVNAIVLWGAFLELARSTFRRVARWAPPRRRNALIAAAAAAAGLGMVALDYHWLTDVLAGWMLGTAMLVGLLRWDPFGPIAERRRRASDHQAVVDPDTLGSDRE